MDELIRIKSNVSQKLKEYYFGESAKTLNCHFVCNPTSNVFDQDEEKVN